MTLTFGKNGGEKFDVGADVTSVALPCETQEQYLATSSPPIVVVNFRMMSLH